MENSTVFGLIAAILILVSFVLRGEKKIRLVNLIGSVFLAIYGITKPDVLIIFMSVAIVLVHCVQFWSMYKEARAKRALEKAEARANDAESRLKEMEQPKEETIIN